MSHGVTPEPPTGSEHYREGWRTGYEQHELDVRAELEQLRAAPSADQVRGAVGWLLDYYGKPRSPWSAEEDQTDAAHRVLGDGLAEKLITAFSRLAELQKIRDGE